MSETIHTYKVDYYEDSFREQIQEEILEMKKEIGDDPHQLLFKKMEYYIDWTHSNGSSLIRDCIPDFFDTLEMFRDNKYTLDKETPYLKMICFILEDLWLIEGRTYISYLTQITEEGLEMLNPEFTTFYENFLIRMHFRYESRRNSEVKTTFRREKADEREGNKK